MANNEFSFRIIKSSKGTDKLSHDGYLYIYHRGTIKKQLRCDVRGCKGSSGVARLVISLGHGYMRVEFSI